mgnify:CR=1 FL=1
MQIIAFDISVDEFNEIPLSSQGLVADSAADQKVTSFE